jgi:acylpyruvate hydrolase
MKWVSYLRDGQARAALVAGDAAIDLHDACPEIAPDLRSALLNGVELRALADKLLVSRAPRLALAELRYAPIIPDPGKIICLGLNYLEHAREAQRDLPEYPWLFCRTASSLLAHKQPAYVPRISSKLDYEAELAVVIGQRVPRHVSPASATRYVFGYTCFNDLSVRDYQKRTPQWTIGKNFDATGGFGPVLVTADELPDGASGLRIQGRLNGKLMQDANTRDMIFNVAKVIGLLSECMTLGPGDVIVMGTPGGVGQSRTPPVWLQPGDAFEVEIEGIGTLQNPIHAEP